MKHLVLASFLGVIIFSNASLAAPRKTLSRDELMAELTGKDAKKMNDTALYAEIVGAYQRQDQLALQSRVQTLLKRYPQSEYADNALFLAGRSALEHRNYAGAIKYFSRVTELYPHGNKVAAAQFAKGVTYRKMNLEPLAKEVFQNVKKKYPGSPESFRASNELKQIR